MKVIKSIGIGLLVLVIVVVAVGFLLPAEFTLSRSTTINAPIEVVFDQVVDLEKNEAWSPWAKADPTMKMSYGEKTVGTGASYTWTSEKSGDGKLTIREVEQNQRILNDIDFGGQAATGHWDFEASGEGTKVTWSMKGDAGGNIIGRYMGLMVDMMAGPQFELGLAELKKIAETAPPAKSADAGSEPAAPEQ